jgi:hypothetical protein
MRLIIVLLIFAICGIPKYKKCNCESKDESQKALLTERLSGCRIKYTTTRQDGVRSFLIPPLTGNFQSE